MNLLRIGIGLEGGGSRALERELGGEESQAGESCLPMKQMDWVFGFGSHGQTYVLKMLQSFTHLRGSAATSEKIYTRLPTISYFKPIEFTPIILWNNL